MQGKIISRPLLFMAGTAMAISSVGGYAWHEAQRPKMLEVYAFDEPGSPVVLIRTPNDKRILIDGGSNADVVRRITGVLPFYSRRIDTVVVTVADAAHATGLIDVLSRYKVDQVVMSQVSLQSLGLPTSTDAAFDIFVATVSKNEVALKKVMAGERLVLDSFGPEDVNLDVLFPVDPSTFKYSKASAPQLVLRLSYGSTSIVFMGGADLKLQKFIATDHSLPTDVIMFSKSLSAANVSRALLEAADPKSVIYSQAMNGRQGSGPDPAAAILKEDRFNLKEKDQVKMISDGHSLSVQ